MPATTQIFVDGDDDGGELTILAAFVLHTWMQVSKLLTYVLGCIPGQHWGT